MPVAHPGAARSLRCRRGCFCFIVVFAAGITSYRNWRMILRSNAKFSNATATDRREFMALLGVFVSITLGMGVLWLSIPPLVIELCMRAR